jgi:thymidylate kinase
MVEPKGRLIVFEGVDAAGKTTLCDDLCESLRHKQLPVQRYQFPGKTPGTLGELVDRIHHHHRDKFCIPGVNPCALQLLHIAAHIDIIESAIKRAVSEGAWVVLDRFWWSTYVYGRDGGVSEQSLELMIQLEKTAYSGPIRPPIP